MKPKFLATKCTITERNINEDSRSGNKSEYLELKIEFTSSGNTSTFRDREIIHQALSKLAEISPAE